MPDTCGSCRFFERVVIGQPFGNCHGRPPFAVMVGHNTQGLPVVNTYWPRVPDTAICCGDFARRVYADIDLAKLPAVEMERAGDRVSGAAS